MTEPKKNQGKRKQLSEAALQARREYFREYNRKNREKRKQWNQNHWENVAARQAEEKE